MPPVTALTSSLDGSEWAQGLDLPCLCPGAPEQSLQWRPCPEHLPLVSQAVIFMRYMCFLSVIIACVIPCLIRLCVVKSSARPWHRWEAAECEDAKAGSVKQLQGSLCWLMPNRVWYHSCRTAAGGHAGPGSFWIDTRSSYRLLLPNF